MNQRNDSRANWRDPGPNRADQPQRSRYRDSSEELFGRQSFGAPEDTHYYGTGAAGWGGPGFTGGAYAYGNGPRDQERPIESEEYSDESAVSYEQANRPAYRQGPGPRYGHYPVVRARNPYPQGPKGYQRSDERMQEDISERLMESHYIDCSDVSVEVRGGKVVLEGTVPVRNMKHAIEDLVDACPGVQDIDNRVRVAGAVSQSQSQSQSPSTGALQPSLQTGAAGSSSRQ
jgi:hypothetical protein